MRSQRRLLDELRFVAEFNTLFDVVQQVAVSQLRRLEDVLSRQVPLKQRILDEFVPLLPPEAAGHPFMREGSKGKLIIAITSDEGMVGPLHTGVIREAMAKADEATRWLLIGQRGMRFLGNQAQMRVIPVPPEERTGEQFRRLTQFILDAYRQQSLREVWLVAPRFVSITRQDIVSHRLLPLDLAPDRRVNDPRELVIEPSVERVIEQLASVWVETVSLEVFWSARRAEYAARAMHVEASRHELSRRSRKVRHEYFKTMHERVDVMVRESCVVQRSVASRRAKRAEAALAAALREQP